MCHFFFFEHVEKSRNTRAKPHNSCKTFTDPTNISKHFGSLGWDCWRQTVNCNHERAVKMLWHGWRLAGESPTTATQDVVGLQLKIYIFSHNFESPRSLQQWDTGFKLQVEDGWWSSCRGAMGFGRQQRNEGKRVGLVERSHWWRRTQGVHWWSLNEQDKQKRKTRRCYKFSYSRTTLFCLHKIRPKSETNCRE